MRASSAGAAAPGPSGAGRLLQVRRVDERRTVQASFGVVAERYRTAYAASPTGLVLLSPDGVVRDANPAFCRFLESPAPALVDRPFLDLVCIGDAVRVQRLLDSTLTDEVDSAERLLVRFIAGGERWGQLTITEVRNRGGAPLMLVVHVEDRSEHVAALRQLHQLSGARLVGEVAGGVVHDIHNVLSVVVGQAELLASELGEEGRKRCAIMRSAASRAEAMTRRLLDVAKLAPFEPELVDVGAVASAMFPVLEALTLSGQDLVLVRDDDAVVEADAIELERVLLTLVVNAIDAIGPRGSVLVHVFVEPDRHGRDVAVLRIADDGEGMDRETLEHAFDPFFSTKGRDGVGLGLATVRSTIAAFNGTVRVNSAPGRGTTVDVRLPSARSS